SGNRLSSNPTPSHFGKTLLQALTILTGVYLLLAVVLTFAQRKLMYFPTNLRVADALKMARAHGFSPWENNRGEIIGWKRVCKSVPPRGQVLILHGNAGWALNWAHYADGLQNVEPLDIYILEYPGYGIRVGSPSQKTIFAAADEGMALLERNGPV